MSAKEGSSADHCLKSGVPISKSSVADNCPPQLLLPRLPGWRRRAFSAEAPRVRPRKPVQAVEGHPRTHRRSFEPSKVSKETFRERALQMSWPHSLHVERPPTASTNSNPAVNLAACSLATCNFAALQPCTLQPCNLQPCSPQLATLHALVLH